LPIQELRSLVKIFSNSFISTFFWTRGNLKTVISLEQISIIKSVLKSFRPKSTMTIQNTLLSNRNPALMISSKKSFGNNQLQPLGTFSGILFDMDGTLIDSTDAIVKFWTRYVPPDHVPRSPFQRETDKPLPASERDTRLIPKQS
jgi:hypothetical protein